jgi:acyl carrier protein
MLQNRINIKDKDLSNKTLKRKIAELKNEFGIEIKFNRKRNGYHVTTESLNENLIYYKRINQYYLNEILLHNKQLVFIELDDEELYTSFINIKKLVYAISTHTEIKFLCKKEGNNVKELTVRPCFFLK